MDKEQLIKQMDAAIALIEKVLDKPDKYVDDLQVQKNLKQAIRYLEGSQIAD